MAAQDQQYLYRQPDPNSKPVERASSPAGGARVPNVKATRADISDSMSTTVMNSHTTTRNPQYPPEAKPTEDRDRYEGRKKNRGSLSSSFAPGASKPSSHGRFKTSCDVMGIDVFNLTLQRLSAQSTYRCRAVLLFRKGDPLGVPCAPQLELSALFRRPAGRRGFAAQGSGRASAPSSRDQHLTYVTLVAA